MTDDPTAPTPAAALATPSRSPVTDPPPGAAADSPAAPAATVTTAAALASAPLPAAAATASAALVRGLLLAVVLLALVCAAALVVAWKADQRVAGLEEDLVRRQRDSGAAATEARALARQAQDSAADAAARLGLVDARVTELSVQRTQLDELIQSVSRSRDDNLVVDVDSAVRVAQQQAGLTGSAEPLVAVLQQAADRLARRNDPRLEPLRRAVGRDLERLKSTALPDAATLAVRLDALIREVDELPLRADPVPVREREREPAAPAASAAAPVPSEAPAPGRLHWLGAAGSAAAAQVWHELRSLVRVTRIDRPDAMLLAPEQGFYLRENVKLRLLDARLALLSRQYEIAQSDLQAARAMLTRYFEAGSRRGTSLADGLEQIASQARRVAVPKPEETLAALAIVAPR